MLKWTAQPDTQVVQSTVVQYSDSLQAGPAMNLPPPPRLCAITKVPTFHGFGFTLHADKETQSQLIGL